MKNEFPHLSLKLTKNAPPKKNKGFQPKKNTITEGNKQNRNEHGKELTRSVEFLKSKWIENKVERESFLERNITKMPEAISLHLKIDPNALPLEELRKFDIEVISELEDGFIIGASDDTSLEILLSKIEKFQQKKESKAAGLWEITTGTNWKLNILSPELLEKYDKLDDDEILILDIGIACLSTINIPDHPAKRKYTKVEAEEKALERWEKKRQFAYQEWNKIAKERTENFRDIIDEYNGNILSMEHGEFDPFSILPDSINCRIRVSFNCMKHLLFNHPFIFEITEAEEVAYNFNVDETDEDVDISNVKLDEPSESSPYICVIDSGIAEGHILLKSAIKSSFSRSWVGNSTDVADYVDGGGHGTKVAGGILYHDNVPINGMRIDVPFWIQNARVLDENNELPVNLFPSSLLNEIVDYYYNQTKTRIYNHSINSLYPCRTIHMSAWAATIDQLSWEKDVLFVVSSGNLPLERPSISSLRLGIIDHLNSGRKYPEYLLESSCRIADPAQSLQAITVGSVGISELAGLYSSFSKESEPSSFSCTGPGIWGSIKPEVVEFGGDLAYDGNTPPNLTLRSELSPLLVRSTMHGGAPVGKDDIGTSFATAKVSHILANIEKTFPNESTLFYKTLLVHSARWPEWAESHPRKDNVVRSLGYGIPNKIRATENDTYRITLVTSGDRYIKSRQVHVYEVKVPEELRKPSTDYQIRIDITLSYKAQPRRTRRNRKRYLSKWLDWKTSKENESTEDFLNRVIEVLDTDEPYSSSGENQELINWMIRERDDWGQVKGINRSTGTVQKDWAIIESNKLKEGFCIAVIGHDGWNNEPDGEVPYSLAVSFEALQKDVELYQLIAVENNLEVDVNV
jgi:Subtilase family